MHALVAAVAILQSYAMLMLRIYNHVGISRDDGSAMCEQWQ